MSLSISIHMDYIKIEDDVVWRPSRIARGEWIKYWEHVFPDA